MATLYLQLLEVTSELSNTEEHQYYSHKQVHVGVHSDTVGNMLNVKE